PPRGAHGIQRGEGTPPGSIKQKPHVICAASVLSLAPKAYSFQPIAFSQLRRREAQTAREAAVKVPQVVGCARHRHAARSGGSGRAGWACGGRNLEEVLRVVDLIGVEEPVKLAN